MAIQISPKRKIKIPLWALIVISLCAVLILGEIISYFYFNSNIKAFSLKIQEKETEFLPLEKAIKEKKEELIPLKQKINDFAVLLEGHKNNLDIFRFIEEKCLPRIWFSSFDFSGPENIITLSGTAESFTVLENQIFVFSKENRVHSLSLSDVKINREKGGVDFTLTFIFNI